jgi:hypothetical protein
MMALMQSEVGVAVTFWDVLAALSLLGILVMLAIELPKIRREMASRQVEGLRLANEVLQSDEFLNCQDMILRVWRDGGEKYPVAIEGQIRGVFSRLNYLAKLVQLGYVEAPLLFYMFLGNLQSLEKALSDFEARQNSHIPEMRDLYPKGYALLKEAGAFSPQSFEEASERQLVDYLNWPPLKRLGPGEDKT